ncbi:phage virion morphogenesis protein [Wielerella bovis]|uniref:phage virion morphogenesis protein n=1 Tax=Wielerella bovis TaxID=2917790 RepID=UPI002019A5B4|nr:phage virion morphogenesis protein [Wielerella bovis]MCG7657123.1 phage virion morphogenesis protein [Wielerella bovis]MCG7659346.1 phage virion morphogenesis protein [Wielerella bovis]ULJ64057.1 phage virion morphogenesis protein [Wielerella bovis]ULJ67481.1 phage virion morphogenesis protein [Wielerella bovis]
MQIQVELTMPPQWLRLLDLDLREPMREIGRRLETSVIQNYNQQRSPAGVAWIPSQRAKKDGGKTLIDTGRMLASLSFVSGNDWVEIGYPQGSKNIPAWLHFGVPKNNLPAREHLGVRHEDEVMIERTVRDYFTALLA